VELNTDQQREAFSQKNTYTADEKKYIMQQLNAQRLEEREKKDAEHLKKEKQGIFRNINDRRLEDQLYKEIEVRRIEKKKKYTFDIREFYKFEHMERGYYIEIKDIKKLSSKPQIFTLYYRTFGEMKKKDFLIKTEIYSDKVFISSDVLRVYFKGYSLENER